MSAKENAPKIALPRSWKDNVKSAMLHVISLAQFGMAYTRGWAANSINARIRLKAKCERLEQQVARLTEEIRIKDARMARLDARNRPHYPASERMAILLLRAAHGWSLKQTAHRFLVTSATIASWVKRVDEQGPKALVQLREPVNKFPVFVRYAVQRLKAVCPGMGKVKIAQVLCRAGLHLCKNWRPLSVTMYFGSPIHVFSVSQPNRDGRAIFVEHQFPHLALPTSGFLRKCSFVRSRRNLGL
jgi:cell division protein FtsB